MSMDSIRARTPSHLVDLLMDPVPPETSPWSLSGPQFPPPTAIQQRYCYPKGRREYSNRKGGALWTMYGTDGQEDLEFRLLHVYFSAKRAVNKGVNLKDSELAASTSTVGTRTGRFQGGRSLPLSSSSPAAKRMRKDNTRTPTRYHRRPYDPSGLSSPPHHRSPHIGQSPAITASTAGSPSLCSSPLSFELLSNANSPTSTTGGPEGTANTSPFSRFHPISEATFLTPSPFRGRPSPQRQLELLQQQQHHRHSIQQSPVVGLEETNNESKGGNKGSGHNHNELYYDMDSSLQELDSYWSSNDPFMTLMLKPSLDQGDGGEHHPTIGVACTGSTLHGGGGNSVMVRNMAARLESIRESLRKSILTAVSSDQAALTSLVATWARQVAKDPLGSTHYASKNNTSDSKGNGGENASDGDQGATAAV